MRAAVKRIGLASMALAIAACASGTETPGAGGGGTTTSSTSGSTTSSTSSTTSSTSTSSSTTTSSNTGGTGTGGTGTGGTGTGGTGTGVPCHWNKTDPCGPGMFCDALGCGDGHCKPVGTTEAQDRAPVCGCDGVTYWNLSVSASHGMAVQSSGVCSPAKTCGGIAGLPCPAGAACNYHLADKAECGASDLAGSCWAIPSTCPQILIGPTQHACQSSSCTDECNLIKLMTPWYDDPTCPQ